MTGLSSWELRFPDRMPLPAARLRGLGVDHALVSPARRTRETYADLGLTGTVEHLEALYQADPDALRAAVAGAPDGATALLVVAHNPGVHQLALELAEPGRGAAAQRLAYSFPTGTAVGLRVSGDWADLGPGLPLEFVHLALA